MPSRFLTAAVVLLLAGHPVAAQSIRDRIRLKPEQRTPITEEQANELTLTLNDAAVRPIQVWVRVAGRIDARGRTVTATVAGSEARYVKVGQRVRAFPPASRSSMFQARVTAVSQGPSGLVVTATLSGPSHAGSERYVLEIVTEPIEALSVPNEAIIEADGQRIVYVQAERGRHERRVIEVGLQGELFTQVLAGLKMGDQVVTFGSFFIDADYRLKG